MQENPAHTTEDIESTAPKGEKTRRRVGYRPSAFKCSQVWSCCCILGIFITVHIYFFMNSIESVLDSPSLAELTLIVPVEGSLDGPEILGSYKEGVIVEYTTDFMYVILTLIYITSLIFLIAFFRLHCTNIQSQRFE